MIRLLGTFFYSGRSPVMPGTCGSIAAWLLLFLIPGDHYAVSCLVLALVTTLVGPALARAFMAEGESKDPQDFVWDEAAGLYIAVWRPILPSLESMVLGLVLFRILDMTKPWPIRRIERLPRGYGVVYDDVVAGLIALALGMGIEHYLF